MRKVKLTKELQQRFLEAPAETGSVSTAAAVAGTSRTRVYELRKADPAFAQAWQDAEEVAADRIHDEVIRRAVDGVDEPLVSGGKLIRDDKGEPIIVKRYSDQLLLALSKAHRPPKRERSVRSGLPKLESTTDARNAMASIAAAVAAGEITPSEAVELSAVVQGFLSASEASDFDQRLQVMELKNAQKNRR
jgi:hypothetical protein